MTPQELKNSILQLAIQGKLVEQRPEEGTGEELYREIQREKAALIKAGKIKKEKPLPEIKEEDVPFEIPETWKWVRLNYIAESGLGKTLDKGKNTGEFCPYLCSINVYWEGIRLDTVKQARFSKEDKAKYLLKKGDLLICEGGDVGRSAIWDSDEVMYYQNALHRVRFYGNIYAVYFKYIFECYKGTGILDEHSKGMTIKHLVHNSLYDICFPLPPLAEQKRIVAKIEELLPYIDRYDAAWNRLEDFNKRFPEDLRKSILQLAIQGKLVEQRPEEGTGEELQKKYFSEKIKIQKNGIFKGRKTKAIPAVSKATEPYDIPNNWAWVRLGNLVEIFGRIGFRGYTKQDIVDKGLGAITISPSNIDSSGNTIFDACTYISWDKYEESPEIKVLDGDIILVKTGSSYGKCGIVRDLPEKATINPQLVVLKYILCDVNYLNIALKSQMAREQFEQFVIGTSIPTFSQEKLSNMLIPLPPIAEQKRIVERVEELLAVCEGLKL